MVYVVRTLASAALAAIAGLGLFASAQPAGAAIFYVGTNGGLCDATTLQAGIDLAQANPGSDEIRLTKTQVWLEHTIIDGTVSEDPLLITGGWSSCLDAQPDGLSSVEGTHDTFLHAAIEILGGATPGTPNVTLRDLDLKGYLNGSDASTPLLVQGNGTPQVLVQGSSLSQGLVGAGISVGSLTIDAETRLHHAGIPGFGSGIYCISSDATVHVYGVVHDNIGADGAGISANGGCVVHLYSGAEVRDNTASDGGGGVFLRGGSQLHAGIGAQVPTVIRGNSAARGGGLHATELGTQAFLGNVHVTENTAEEKGGAYLVEHEALVRHNRWNGTRCTSEPRCSVIAGNRLTNPAFNDGIAVFVESGARAELGQVFVESNLAASNRGRLIQVEGAGSSALMEAVQIWDNRAEFLLSARSNAVIDAAFTSAAFNGWLDAGIPHSSGAAAGQLGGVVNLYSSIFVDTEGAAGTVNGHCLIVDDATGIDNPFAVSVVGVPDTLFIDREGGNLHLRSGSPAIDYCSSAAYTPFDRDIDVEHRNFDDPSTASLHGNYDLGVDEYTGIFADGFESGNTAAWSSAAP